MDINGNRLCSAGKDSICVDLDGKIYKCHGCIFSDDKDSHYINNIRYWLLIIILYLYVCLYIINNITIVKLNIITNSNGISYLHL